MNSALYFEVCSTEFSGAKMIRDENYFILENSFHLFGIPVVLQVHTVIWTTNE